MRGTPHLPGSRIHPCVALPAGGLRGARNYFSIVSHDNARALVDLAAARRLDPGSAEIINTIGDTLLAKGEWEESIRLHREAEKLDPRTASHLGGLLTNMRRYSEAASVVDRQLAALPGNFTLLMSRTMIYLAQGDLAGARHFLGSARNVEQTRLIVELAQVYDLVWVLDDAERAMLLRLTPSAFDDNKPVWALALAQASALSHDAPGVKRYAEEANRSLEEQIRLQPDNADWHIYRGIALAYLGRRDEAIREGQRGCELLPISRDAVTGAYCQHLLARIYIMAGQPDRAIDTLEPLLRIPYALSPGWLRIDPTFDPLRGNPRFEKLLSTPAAPA